MSVRGTRRWMMGVTSTIAVVLVATACSNSLGSVPSGGTSTAPGVTSDTITVGSLATLSGQLSAGFGDVVYGVKAYFDMVNAQGGVDGRRIDLRYVVDDAANPTTDEDQARNLVQQDHVFAIVGVGSPFFTADQYLARTGTPTFGYMVSGNWDKYPNLFGAYSSVLDYTSTEESVAFVAQQLGAHSVAVIAYGAVSQSKDACAADIAGLERFGVQVRFEDLDLPIYGDPTTDVQQMASHHTDVLFTCLDGVENLKFVQTMHQYGLGDVHTVWQNGYDRNTVSQNASVMTGSIFALEHVPFEATQAFPGKYPGMDRYIAVMNRYEPQWTYDDISIQGWINAAQFVAGLRAVGRDLTQQKLVAAINSETSFTAGGLIPFINWKVAHTSTTPPYCSSYVEVTSGGKLKPVFVQNGDEAFVCFNGSSDRPIPLPGHVPPSS
ncbi:MAG: ABC transporter substrate-binding protein [Acidimicrobiales bacterium]